MIHRQRHKKGIAESNWRGCPVKVLCTFTGHPLFCEKCCTAERNEGKRRPDYSHLLFAFCMEMQKSLSAFMQSAELHKNEKKSFLIGKVFSYLTVTLPDMEFSAGGEHG